MSNDRDGVRSRTALEPGYLNLIGLMERSQHDLGPESQSKRCLLYCTIQDEVGDEAKNYPTQKALMVGHIHARAG